MEKTSKEKLNEIMNGWGNWLFKSPEVEAVAKERAKLCSECPSIKGNTCGECHCPLFAKTRSMKETNKCPLDKWEK